MKGKTQIGEIFKRRTDSVAIDWGKEKRKVRDGSSSLDLGGQMGVLCANH